MVMVDSWDTFFQDGPCKGWAKLFQMASFCSGFEWTPYMTMVVAEVSLDMPVVNPLTSMSDQDKISPYNINTVLTR